MLSTALNINNANLIITSSLRHPFTFRRFPTDLIASAKPLISSLTLAHGQPLGSFHMAVCMQAHITASLSTQPIHSNVFLS